MNAEKWKELCDKHGTDKGNFSWIYPQLFERYRNKPIKLLEIGALRGESLQVFNEYFSDIEIYSLDCSSDWKSNKNLLQPNITIFEGYQSDIKTLHDVYQTTGPLDIIIDDGSHLVGDIISSFEFFKDKFRELYIIEDTTLTLHGSHYRIANESNIDYLHKLQLENSTSLLQNRDFYEQYWAGQLRELDNDNYEKPFVSITFYRNLTCIRKTL